MSDIQYAHLVQWLFQCKQVDRILQSFQTKNPSPISSPGKKGQSSQVRIKIDEEQLSLHVIFSSEVLLVTDWEEQESDSSRKQIWPPPGLGRPHGPHGDLLRQDVLLPEVQNSQERR